MDIREELERLADKEYKEFHSALLPTVDRDRIIGVRLPQLRAIAARIKRAGPKGTLPELPQGDTLEETLVRGFVIAGADMPLEEHLKAVAGFVPEIDCWSVCDSFVTSLKFVKKDRERVWEFIQPYFESDRTYDIRFAAVMSLAYFKDGEYVPRVFEKFDKIENDDYYVKMAVAWAISVFFVNAREETRRYLENNRLDDFTFNKSLQKIIESYRVTPQDKAEIRAMKRK
jgi:3-methyladenine DNA glycosylase AlkD